MPAQTIDDVLRTLAAIVADTRARKDPLGYFAALYRQVTLTVKGAVAQGDFDDNPRMSRFDAQFANAYFTAYRQYRGGTRPSRCWQLAFDAAGSGRLLILQNLLLAINAHINLDLGVVTGSTFVPGKIDGFHDDFNRINAILAGLIPRTRAVVEGFSPRLNHLAEVGGPDLALALEFSVDTARDEAWRSATVVSFLPAAARPLAVSGIDARTKLLGRLIADPPEPVGAVVPYIRAAESTDVAAIITALDSIV